jgi:site-specific DNA-methyltransferase (adenine-specific)
MEPTTQLHQGDCREILKTLPDNSIDSVVTDPPYELGFMGKKWDNTGIAYDTSMWAEVLRVLKPGGHLLAFGGTRTYHRMVVAIEDAGFEIRDSIHWIYGSGFPKSLNVGKQDGCEAWDGWGTALKPAHEPIVVARKPLIGTVAANVLQYGTGAMNIDGCRVAGEPDRASGWSKSGSKAGQNTAMSGRNYAREPKPDNVAGRWPANVIHDGSDEVTAMFPENTHRFFYAAKASRAERNAENTTTNNHPTVKPIALMRYLLKLVTPPNGTTLDPFAGSGTTLAAAIHENFHAIGIELTPEYHPIIQARIQHAQATRKPIQ